jgi:hypothetical protein
MGPEIEEALRNVAPAIAAELRRFLEEASKPLVPGDPRRHHYVAQFYLRRFADAAERIGVLRLEGPHTPTVTHIKNAAVIKDFYTVIDHAGADTVVIEKLIAMVEGTAAPAIERLATGVAFPPSAQDRIHLALWVALQFVRDPLTRRRAEAMADAIVKMNVPLIATEEKAREYLRDRFGTVPTQDDIDAFLDGVNKLEWETVPSQNDLVRLMLESAIEIAPYLLARRWCVVRFPEPGLVTCDRPIVLHQYPENRGPFLGLGIATADEAMIPLDRRALLVMHIDPAMGEVVLPAAPGQTVADFNAMLVFNAHEEIYCHPDDVTRVQALSLPTGDRPLFTVEGGAWGDRPFPDGIDAAPERKRARRYSQSRNMEHPGATDRP